MMSWQTKEIIPVDNIREDYFKEKNSSLYLLREDLIHPEISGNKWRKLKYNFFRAKRENYSQLLTFGGAYSNHIAATAAAGKKNGFKTIGIIRGEEVLPLNSTLQLAQKNGMLFQYVSRENYKKKKEKIFIDGLRNKWGDFYMIPEGGSNAEAILGCTEILDNVEIDFDVVCCACGTGGTISGIIATAKNEKKIFGFPALKGGQFLEEEIQLLLDQYSNNYNKKIKNKNWELITNYHFGGYAKVTSELVSFVQRFNKKHNIQLDYIYTGKMMFGIYDLIRNSDVLDNKKVLVIHTGGIQGNKGIEEKLNTKP